tara:strand:- start:25312 stop:27267 length:1956 start_codon:yes stop_codon:yes gene_type:complete
MKTTYISIITVLFISLFSSYGFAQSNTCQTPTPNILLLLDKSGSMQKSQKWDNAKAGILQMVQQFDQKIRFGLMTFSDAPQHQLDFGASLSAFQSTLSSLQTGGETYMQLAMTTATTYLKKAIAQDTQRQRPHYILLITDGAPTDACPTKETTALRKLPVGQEVYDIKTFVIGFGSSVNPVCLNDLAKWGGTSQGSSRLYHVVSTLTDFNKALQQISTKTTNSEVCNGLDDDCDGKIDNVKGSDKPLLQACPFGRCAAHQYCADGKWGACTPNAPPTKEICNYKDDDCDGFIDNIPGDQQPYTLKRPCKDNCGDGVQTCRFGKWGACVGKAKVETCNNIDDDCDGKIDEALQRNCGECGTQSCSAGRWQACQSRPKTQETCNGKDDDCDGFIDNAPDTKKDNTLSIACKNDCHEGKQFCTNGKLSACNAPKVIKEICDGKDNDCNGVIDDPWKDKLGKTPVTCQTSCVQGIYQCKADKTGVYCAGTGENKEICDGKDNDCNGKIDELWPLKDKLCHRGEGSCRQFGKYICNDDQSGITCSAATPPQKTEEICDGLDNDCDGKTDEDLQKACEGTCGEGVQLCREGKWTTCLKADDNSKTCEPAFGEDQLEVKLGGCLCSSTPSPSDIPWLPIIAMLLFFTFQRVRCAPKRS